jgi:leucyl/phenylalanyl-tRNA--protein transferase
MPNPNPTPTPRPTRLDPDRLLGAYAEGVFPMADPDGKIRWYTADPRGVLPLEGGAFHVPRTLQQILRQGRFEIRINHDFESVMRACMATRPARTWINDDLIAAYVRLHEMGHAHSVEAWHDGELGGGLYGVSLGGAFFGESMFHFRKDAGKAALVALVERLRRRGYVLLDTQTCSDHLKRFGGIEVAGAEYLRRLKEALKKKCQFDDD